MGRSRSRSRSPIRRRRSRSRDREHRRDRERRKDRSRSRDNKRRDRDIKDRPKRDHERRRSRSRSPPSRSRSVSPRDRGGGRRVRDESDRKEGGKGTSAKTKQPILVIEINDDDMEGKSQDEIDMMRMMGFAGFDTTKGKRVEGNDAGGVHQVIRRKYRQYMNRRGGFNRPLDFVN